MDCKKTNIMKDQFVIVYDKTLSLWSVCVCRLESKHTQTLFVYSLA